MILTSYIIIFQGGFYMKKFYDNSSYNFKLDKNIQKGMSTIRKIRNTGVGSYTVAIPPKIVSDIQKTLNTNELKLSIRTGRELFNEIKDFDNMQFIILEPYIKENEKEVENVS
jgi:hypothetical protein